MNVAIKTSIAIPNMPAAVELETGTLGDLLDTLLRGSYFSKEVIPYGGDDVGPGDPSPVFHHVGVYAYRPVALAEYPLWGEGRLERLEGLEQLRFLEHGRRILCVEVEARGQQFWELNNPQDVPRLEEMMRAMNLD